MASFGVDCNTADGDTLRSRNEANEFAGGMFILANATISTSSYPILGLNEVSQRTDERTSKPYGLTVAATLVTTSAASVAVSASASLSFTVITRARESPPPV